MMLLSVTLEVVATICHDHQMYVNIVVAIKEFIII